MLNLVGLLYPYADPYTVDTGFDQHLLILVPRYRQRIEEDFGRRCCFYFGDIVSL